MVLSSMTDKELLNLRDSIQEKIESSDELIFSSLMDVAGFMPDVVELRAELAAIDEELRRR